MLEIIEQSREEEPTIPMIDMAPGMVGVVVGSKHSNVEGHIVMRTFSSNKFEVMDLSDPGEDSCWSGHNTIKVRPLARGESVTIKISNDSV